MPAKGQIVAPAHERFMMQRRLVCTNYKVLRNIIAQRTGHRLKFWQQFIDDVIAQVDHPELLMTKA